MAVKIEPDFKLGKVGFFRFKELNGSYIITNDAGNFHILSAEQFDDFVHGRIRKAENLYLDLSEKGFIRGEEDVDSLSRKYIQKNLHLTTGPNLHIVVVTLRCNFKCIYCQTSSQDIDRKDLDMDTETAEKVVDMIYQTPNDSVVIEFQGGEPLLNWDTVKFIVDYSIEKQQITGKNLYLSLVTNGSLLTEDKLEFLMDRKVAFCFSVDGPEEVHNHNRGRNYKKVKKALQDTTAYYRERYPQHLPGALTTVTRFSLDFPREIVDEYLELGQEGIHLRPVNPIGVAKESPEKWHYSIEEFLEFYREAMDYIIEVNKKGRFFMERYAQIFLTKILTETDPGFVDIMSPCGAGTGQLAYNHNGDVYTCDEGRMLAILGDDSFKIGNVFDNSLSDVLENPVVKTTCVASCLDGIPYCDDCVYKPYCGVCPVMNYIDEGSIFSKMPMNDKHVLYSGILDYLFEKIQDTDTLKIFKTWVDRDENY